MSEFARHDVPLAVAVIDMDWHITNPPSGVGQADWLPPGTQSFPDPKKFLAYKRGLHHSIFFTLMAFVTFEEG